MITLTGVVTGLQRVDSSKLGNPRYMFVVNDKVIYTAPNSSYGYCISGWRDKEITCDVSLKRGKLVLINIQSKQG